MATVIEQAIEVLERTNDGEDLAPCHLYLVQLAANDQLSDKGREAWAELVQQVAEGYRAPWFHGIEHLTIDHRGFVRWRGRQVEHYSSPWAYSEAGKASAIELAERCRILEARGEVPTTLTAVWRWDEGEAAAGEVGP